MTNFNLKKLPNRITVSRILLVFVFVILANISDELPGFFIPKVDHQTSQVCHIIAYIVAILAGLTDLADGFLARKYHLESDFGRLMDPLADKIFIVGTFVMMAEYKIMPGWVIIVVLTREFMVTGLRMLASHKGVVISADKLGKLKTVLQMGFLLFGGFAWVYDPKVIHEEPYWGIWYCLLLIMTAVTLISGVRYFVRNKNIYMDIA